jgi:hypothetical protein
VNNASQIVLRFPNDTTVDICGDSQVIQQILNRLDGLEIVYTAKIGFSSGEEK